MMKDKTASRIRSIVAHVVLIILSFMCLFFFYVLILMQSFRRDFLLFLENISGKT